MPSDVTTDFTRDILAHPRDGRALVFLELSQPQLTTPIRVVNDSTVLDPATGTRVPYIYSGKTYTAFPFEMALVTDSARIAGTKLRIQNIDKSIGQSLLKITDAVTVTIKLLSSSDFELNGGGTAMVAIGTPTLQRPTAVTYLRNVTWDRNTVEGDLKGLDISREPYPYQRAVAERAPGLAM